MNIDEELMLDAQEDAAAVAFIKNNLPQELQEMFTEEQLYYFLDVIIEYYSESGILDAQPDKEGYIDIDEEAVAKYVAKKPIRREWAFLVLMTFCLSFKLTWTLKRGKRKYNVLQVSDLDLDRHSVCFKSSQPLIVFNNLHDQIFRFCSSYFTEEVVNL